MKKNHLVRIDRDCFLQLAEKLARAAYKAAEPALEEYSEATLEDVFGEEYRRPMLSEHYPSPIEKGRWVRVDVVLKRGDHDGWLVAEATASKRGRQEVIKLRWWSTFPADQIIDPEIIRNLAQAILHEATHIADPHVQRRWADPALADRSPLGLKRTADDAEYYNLPHEAKALSAELADEVTRRMLSEEGKAKRGESPEDVLRRVLESVISDPRVLELTDANRRRLRRDLYQDASEKGFV